MYIIWFPMVSPKDSSQILAFPQLNGHAGQGPRTIGGTEHMGVSENSVPLNPMVNDHYPY